VERIADAARARRLARAIASDILLYHAERVREGIEQDDLFERLREELQEAREYFRARVDEKLAAKEEFVDRAIVDVVVYGSRGVRSRIW
jgi:hypothetical protein